MNLMQSLTEVAARNPKRTAIVAGGRRITYGRLEREAGALAAGFTAQGLAPGDRVLVLERVGIPLYTTLLALFRMGATAVFPEPAMGFTGVRQCLAAANPKGLVGNFKARVLARCYPPLRRIPLHLARRPAGSRRIAPIHPAAPDHAALITFTSGSTGRPKGIVRTHRFLLDQHDRVSSLLAAVAGRRTMVSLPIFVLSLLADGNTAVIPPGNLLRPGRIDPSPVLEQIAALGIDRLLMPPAMLERLAATGTVLPGIKGVFTGGGPVFPDLMRALVRMAPKAEVVAVYGSTEAEPIAHVSAGEMGDEDFAAMQGGAGLLAGTPDAAVRVRIVDHEIVVTGPQVVKGYLDPADDASTKVHMDGDIWHRTGDAGRLDDAGRLWLLGRVDAGCRGRFPFCVETLARGFSGVERAAFVPLGDEGVLAVQARPDADLQGLARKLEAAFGTLPVVRLKRIPTDRRHNSKIDYPCLMKKLKAQS